MPRVRERVGRGEKREIAPEEKEEQKRGGERRGQTIRSQGLSISSFRRFGRPKQGGRDKNEKIQSRRTKKVGLWLAEQDIIFWMEEIPPPPFGTCGGGGGIKFQFPPFLLSPPSPLVRYGGRMKICIRGRNVGEE